MPVVTSNVRNGAVPSYVVRSCWMRLMSIHLPQVGASAGGVIGSTGAVRPTFRENTYRPSPTWAHMSEPSKTSSPFTQAVTVTGSPYGTVLTIEDLVVGSLRIFVSSSVAPCQTD